MRCISCGGSICFENGVYKCTSCNLTIAIENFFENTEVYLCYVENDEQGRRSQSSVNVQKIYEHLENKGVSSFYKRIALDGLSIEYAEKISQIAYNKAKVVLLCASSLEEFNQIIKIYGNTIYKKAIIPICFTSLNILPKELNSFQAITANHIGYISDVEKNVFRLLNREIESDFSTIQNKLNIKNRRAKICILSSLIAIILLCTLYFVFFTPFVLDSQKYSFAKNKVEKGEYIEALTLLQEIKDYRDVENIINTVYNKYDGYYIDENNELCLNLNIGKEYNAEIQLLKTTIDGNVTFEATSKVINDTIDFWFNDNFNNKGNGKILLKNDGINLKIESDGSDGFGNLEYNFSFANRSDAPMPLNMSKDFLLEILNNNYSKEKITSNGYELVEKEYDCYEISNNDITLYMTNLNHKKIGEDLADDELGMGTTADVTTTSSILTYAASAKANLVIPNKVNTTVRAYIENDIMYVPYAKVIAHRGDFAASVAPLFEEVNDNAKIDKNTNVFIATKKSLGNYYWFRLCERVAERYNEDLSNLTMFFEDKNGMYMYKEEGYPDSRGYITATSPGNYQIYLFNKNNFHRQLIEKVEYDSDKDYSLLNELIAKYKK